MSEVVVALLGLLAAPALWALMWLGWRRRARSQSSLPKLPAVPAEVRASPSDGFEAVYVSTTAAGDWLDRVVAHGLGVRSSGRVYVWPQGVLLARAGAPDIWIAAGLLDGARLERGMAGKFVERNGLVVLTWRLGDALLDTGLRLRHEAERDRLVEAVRSMTGAAA